MRNFSYHAPKNVDDALTLLISCGAKSKVLAGGTDLLVQMKGLETSPTDLIDLKRIPELRGIGFNSKGFLEIGSLTTVAELASSKEVDKGYPALARAAASIGSIQTRNKATVGGNICRAAPSADLVPALLVHEAQVAILGPQGPREAQLDEIFDGPGQTVMDDREILTRILVPPSPRTSSSVYLKQGRRKSVDVAIVGAAVFLNWDEQPNICKEARIALASVAPRPMRARRAESILAGREIGSGLIRQCADEASAEAMPISDVYGSAGYKRNLVKALVAKCLRLLIP